MIKKLYNLKKLQINQNTLQREQLLSNILSIDEDIELTTKNISSASVQSIGAINDFKILEIYKNTMKSHIIKISQKKLYLLREVEKYNKIIIVLNKESEQFKYIQDQEDKKALKQLIKLEELATAEYVESKWKTS
jgi:hypothetical protein